MGLFQNLLGDFGGGQTSILDVDKQVETALWRIDDVHIRNLVDSFRCIKHSAAVFLHHGRLNLLPMAQRIDGCPLRDGRRGEHHVLVDLLNGLDDVVRCDDVADSPTCHRKVLGERIQDDGPLPHPRHGRKWYKRMLIAEGCVNIITDDHQIVFLGDDRDFFHGFGGETVACRVARRVDDKCLCALCNQSFQSLNIDLEILFFQCRQFHRNSPCQLHLLRIWCEIRRLQNDFVTVVDDRFQCQIHAQAGRGRDKDLFILYLHVIFLFVVFADFLPQLRIAAKIRILGMTNSCILIRLIYDQTIRNQIRIPQTQIDAVIKGFSHLIRLSHGSALVLPVSFCNKLMLHLLPPPLIFSRW